MIPHDKDQMCDKLVQKLVRGERLEEVEKSHLAECDHCLAEVVRRLDEAAIAGATVL